MTTRARILADPKLAATVDPQVASPVGLPVGSQVYPFMDPQADPNGTAPLGTTVDRQVVSFIDPDILPQENSLDGLELDPRVVTQDNPLVGLQVGPLVDPQTDPNGTAPLGAPADHEVNAAQPHEPTAHAGPSRIHGPIGTIGPVVLQSLHLARRGIDYLHRELAGPLIEALLPADCPGCAGPLPGVNRAGLCAACWRSIEPVVSPLCPRCGAGFPSLIPTGRAGDRPCGRCIDRPPGFDGARCALVYEGPVRALLHLFKFDHRRDLARVFARAIRDAIPPEERFDVVAPVPLHWTRRLKRGYNQSALLARAVGRSIDVRVAPRLLVKRRRTQDQAALDAAARQRNLRGAFAVRGVRWGGGFTRNLEEVRILLVDDILTTGATAEACARVLKNAGAARVFVAAVARTPLTGIGRGEPGSGPREPRSRPGPPSRARR